MDWTSLGIELVGEAEDGLEAYELAKQHCPDLMLIDINMPLMNGIELIEKIGKINEHCKIVIITGYDEFEYAREALRLQVSDYILKPVAKSKLLEVIKRVLSSMDQSMAEEMYSNWAHQKVEASKAYLLSEFFGKWMANSMPKDEVTLQLQLFGFPSGLTTVIVVNLLSTQDNAINDHMMEKDLALFCVNNIVKELCQDRESCLVLNDTNDNVLCFYATNDEDNPDLLTETIRKTIRQYLQCSVYTRIVQVDSILEEMSNVYKGVQEAIDKENAITPVVACAKSYIDGNYNDKLLSLDKLSDKLDISPQYLSKLIRKELGVNYKEYLTQVRIDKAIMFMRDPMMRMYEIADQVGYKSQHYFSAAFKKAKGGMSPNEYKSKHL